MDNSGNWPSTDKYNVMWFEPLMKRPCGVLVWGSVIVGRLTAYASILLLAMCRISCLLLWFRISRHSHHLYFTASALELDAKQATPVLRCVHFPKGMQKYYNCTRMIMQLVPPVAMRQRCEEWALILPDSWRDNKSQLSKKKKKAEEQSDAFKDAIIKLISPLAYHGVKTTTAAEWISLLFICLLFCRSTFCCLLLPPRPSSRPI